jgi:hypothetical protein
MIRWLHSFQKEKMNLIRERNKSETSRQTGRRIDRSVEDCSKQWIINQELREHKHWRGGVDQSQWFHSGQPIRSH